MVFVVALSTVVSTRGHFQDSESSRWNWLGEHLLRSCAETKITQFQNTYLRVLVVKEKDREV